jgi:tRNA (guanine-N7-)-methyltransferase
MEPASLLVRPTPATVMGPLPLAESFPHPGRTMEIDMGCGKGRFLLARARRRPEVNFLGIDRLLGRIRKIERRAIRTGMDNVRLLRMDAYYTATYLIPAASVATYHVFFPDPWPKTRHHRHRLFNEAFMDALARTLVPGGEVHLATDHLPYFDEIAAIVRDDPRFAPAPVEFPTDEERTDFELLFMERKPIGRLSFRLLAPGAPAAP